MNIQLSNVVRRSMKEKKIASLTTQSRIKLNLLVLGSDFPHPVYVVRLGRKEVLKSYDLPEALNTFKSYVFGIVDTYNKLPLDLF